MRRSPAVVVVGGFLLVVAGLFKDSDGALGVVAGLGVVVSGAIASSVLEQRAGTS